MTTSEKVSIWLASQPDTTQELSFSDRQILKNGGHNEIAAARIEKLRKHIRWVRLSAGATGVIMLLAGLFSWAREFGLIEPSAGGSPNLDGLGTVLILGAAAVFSLFRIGHMQKKITLFEGAKEIDAFFDARA